jgi:SAM-dependent methyltransferase
VSKFFDMFRHPLTRDLDIDAPESTLRRRTILKKKALLNKIYREWYSLIVSDLRNPELQILEIGSGAGFLDDHLPNLITSEVFPLEGVNRVEDATNLSFQEESLDAIVMTDVFHHIPDVSKFLSEALRTLRPGGQLVMIEPWNTPWSRFFYTNFHPEPFEPTVLSWQLPKGGPLSGANGALPWIVFDRDRVLFEDSNHELHLKSVVPLMPVAYIAAGGISTALGLPGFLYKPIRFLERFVLQEKGAMFALISIEKI